ncbi:MAG: hypothetical protein H6742_13415 [Alphaproteobacteria bacterium]|nr:hypothetical protein [Alphaproteobacteria bacterium]
MDHLRAILVLLHVLVISVLSFPAPVGMMTERAFSHPDTQASFQSYTDALNAVGVDIDKDEFQQLLWDAGTAFISVRRKVVAPMQPYVALTGTEQGWRMFGSVNRRPAWLRVELKQDGAWRTIYEMRSDEYTWRRQQLDQERVRAVVNNFSWLHSKRTYEDFGLWLARRAAEDFPDATHLRTSMVRRALPPPDELRAHGMPEGTVLWETEYSLDKHR